MIHPTAIIHPLARLAPGVAVGPYAIIEGPAEIGEGCVIHAHAIIGGHVVMGRDNIIGHGALIGGDPQDLSFKPTTASRVVIGDRNRIREYCTIHRGTAEGSETVIGDDCFLMAGTHLAHNVRLGDRVITANNVLFAGHVQVADRVFIGGGCGVHQFVRIGRLAICQGNASLTKDVPPFLMITGLNGVAGMNIVGMRRAGLAAAERAEVKRAFNLLYRSKKNTAQAVAEAAGRDWSANGREFWDFIAAAKKRGICDWLGTRRGAGFVPEE